MEIPQFTKPGKNGLIIKFDSPVVYNPPAPAPITYEQIEVINMIDDPVNKIVTVFINQGDRSYVLWRGDNYDAIGQWTDADVATRLKELLAN